jgi:hypothetical protein
MDTKILQDSNTSPFSCYSNLGYGLEDSGFQFLEVQEIFLHTGFEDNQSPI